jgi:Domain of unknown function (DUF4157)
MLMPKVAKPQTKQSPSFARRPVSTGSMLVRHQPGEGGVEQALWLQRSVGNQARLQRLAGQISRLPSDARGSEHDQDANNLHRAVAVGRWNFSKIPVGRPSRSQAPFPLPAAAAVSAKPFVSVVDDSSEGEANRVADQVMRMGEPRAQDHVEQGVSRGRIPCPSSKDSGLEGSRPLPASVRSHFEPRFGHDFGRVRVHDDDRAARMSQSLHAAAFTVGNDIYFDHDRFAPGDPAGMRLLAHELAHVAQQATKGAPRVQRQSQGEAGPAFHVRNVPTTGWYKGIQNNPWGGLPEVLYPDTPDDFQSLAVIEIDVDQLARIRFDAETIQSQSSGERRLPHKPEWASFFVQGRVSGPGVPTLPELEAEYRRHRDRVMSQIATIKKTELREFLAQRIHVVLPPFSGARGVRSLRRTERLAPPEYGHEERLIRFLLQHPSRS